MVSTSQTILTYAHAEELFLSLKFPRRKLIFDKNQESLWWNNSTRATQSVNQSKKRLSTSLKKHLRLNEQKNNKKVSIINI